MPPKLRDWPERAQGRAFGMQGGVVAAGGAAIPWPRIGPARGDIRGTRIRISSSSGAGFEPATSGSGVLSRSSVFVAAKEEDCVVAAEPKAVAERDVQLGGAGLV